MVNIDKCLPVCPKDILSKFPANEHQYVLIQTEPNICIKGWVWDLRNASRF